MTQNNKRFADGRQYREYVTTLFEEAHQKHAKDDGSGIILMRMSDYPTPERPQDADCWGPWKYVKSNLTLVYAPRDRHWHYEVDLERCNTSAQMLDWIFQLRTKREDLVSAEDIGHFVAALDDLLNPQANICSFGTDSRLNTTRYLLGEIPDRGLQFVHDDRKADPACFNVRVEAA